MEKYFKDRKVLVTGACGTVGKELVRQLLEEFNVGELIGIDNNESELFFLEQSFSDYPQALFLAISESPNSKIAYYIKLVLSMREIYLVQIHCSFCVSFSVAINRVPNPQKNQAVLRRDSYWPILARLDFLLESFN